MEADYRDTSYPEGRPSLEPETFGLVYLCMLIDFYSVVDVGNYDEAHNDGDEGEDLSLQRGSGSLLLSAARSAPRCTS